MIDKNYAPQEIEQKWYAYWLENKLFASKPNPEKEAYTIVIPPPNVTGVLHMGHMLNNTIQDVLIRKARMEGKEACWVPGTDHASIATEAKVVAMLKEKGISKADITREEFLKYAFEWKDKYGGIILDQLKKLGASCDWDRTRFTMEPSLYQAVIDTFVRLYNKGLIYRGVRMVSWDPQGKTAVSDEEVIHKEEQSKLYYLRYKIEGSKDEYITIATTRPETMYADTALMVHPEDERFRDFVGKNAYIPGTERLIPIIQDSYVDIEFGTGCVKVTPAHDPNDFEVGKRHNLEMPLCMEEDGVMNSLAHKYEGMDRFECRKACVKDLTESGLCTKIEKLIHNVGHSERTGVIVEPRLSKQWFVNMEPLSKEATEHSEVEFIPSRFEKTFLRWMDGTYDWCISRQLWWGHRIPAWYKDDEVFVGKDAPEGEGWKQDEDVLDTWFSSALWPFSTLGWPDNTEDLKRYYPNSVMVTGYDIIFFWVARMIFQGIEFTGESPFKHCLIHGLIRDSDGRKMSKSLGNGVDPLEIKEKYGIDTLRYFLTTNSAPGADLRFEIEKVESSWNFINKLWNISRFTLMNLGDYTIEDVEIDTEELSLADKWILAKLHNTITEMDYNYEKFEFGEAARSIHNFAWDDFASWYVEIAKLPLNSSDEANIKRTKSVLSYVLLDIVKLLHPFMPFVTEEIYQKIPHMEESIVITSWPEAISEFENNKAIREFEMIQELIKSVRNIRAEYNVAPSKEIDVLIKTSNNEITKLLNNNLDILNKFVNPLSLTISEEIEIDTEVISVALSDLEIYLPLGSLVDINQEIERLENEITKLKGEIARGEGMLSNPNFINKAPEEKVAIEREKLENYKEQFETIKLRLEALKK